ncbi:MAG: hypothetical protein KAF91_26930 [Nostoc sp. TH1S01]|nr:hypothetical protein [Nostoc sp. TH1S01]
MGYCQLIRCQPYYYSIPVNQVITLGEIIVKLSQQSKLPKQVAPVQRLSTSSAMSNQQGMEASNSNNVESSGMFDILRMFG